MNPEMQSQLDTHIIRLLNHYSSGISLYDLIKELSSPNLGLLDEKPLKDSITLFQTNFVVMNALYRLNQSMDNDRLNISALKIQKITIETTDNKTSGTITAHDPLADYYLDWGNFDTSSEDIEVLLNSFWQRVSLQDYEAEDLEILALSSPVTLANIKTSYRKLSQQLHPDKGGDSEQFIKVQQAAERLIKRHQPLTLD